MNRKQALRTMAATTVGALGLPEVAKAFTLLADLKGNVNHSVCRWQARPWA